MTSNANFCCANCGGLNVQAERWVHLNHGIIHAHGRHALNAEVCTQFCGDCGGNVYIVDRTKDPEEFRRLRGSRYQEATHG